jgi:hypothetical protein
VDTLTAFVQDLDNDGQGHKDTHINTKQETNKNKKPEF